MCSGRSSIWSVGHGRAPPCRLQGGVVGGLREGVLITRGPTALQRAAPWRVCERERRRRRRRDPDPATAHFISSHLWQLHYYLLQINFFHAPSCSVGRVDHLWEIKFALFCPNSPVAVSPTLLPCPDSCSPCSASPCDRQCCLPVCPPAQAGQQEVERLELKRLTAVTGTSSPTSPPPPLLLSSSPPRS